MKAAFLQASPVRHIILLLSIPGKISSITCQILCFDNFIASRSPVCWAVLGTSERASRRAQRCRALSVVRTLSYGQLPPKRLGRNTAFSVGGLVAAVICPTALPASKTDTAWGTKWRQHTQMSFALDTSPQQFWTVEQTDRYGVSQIVPRRPWMPISSSVIFSSQGSFKSTKNCRRWVISAGSPRPPCPPAQSHADTHNTTITDGAFLHSDFVPDSGNPPRPRKLTHTETHH